jgi:exopolyphosphatase/guanosine-5'-triphosphate,3'-diphosphate pyrophosphatase
MSRVAAVDCGTNSIRLLVTDIAHGRQQDLHREMRVVRLGAGVDRTGSLAPQAIERTRVALVDYAATCRELGVERIRMVATSASRDAANAEDFRAMVRDVLGAEPEVISGGEEAALSFTGATRTLEAADGPFLVMDIGGGSTELVLGTERVEAARSVTRPPTRRSRPPWTTSTRPSRRCAPWCPSSAHAPPWAWPDP